MENAASLIKSEKHKPDIRELTLKHGISFPSDEELIMLLLGQGTKKLPVGKLAQKVCSMIYTTNPDELVEKLMQIEGMGKSKSLTIAAAIELGRRKTNHISSVIRTPSDILPYVQHYALESTEHFITTTLNGAKEIISMEVVSVGTINKALVHPREIFSNAVKEHASGIICCHNHPCGKCQPSNADRESTEIIRKAGEILGITLLDHIIITRSSYFSFLENGLLDGEEN